METSQLERTVKLQEAAPCQDGSEAEPTQGGQDRDGRDGMDRRGAERAPMDCPVRFTSEERLGDATKAEGTLRDLSKTGCKIFSLEPPAHGSQITLVLFLPDGEPPMYLLGTIVRHVRGPEFGAEFLPLTPAERRRLQAIIFKHLTWSVFSLRRPAFRFAVQ